ncbi:divalent metal cation transporter [Algoriphagus persicinus]|uniref:divalent metal cation transporter n=1 Tax=Algoriphagus persicinus TaxID=3108754 RepID=UPI002B3F8002|nr:divalent metal cation transporter [Algoriphagus sp. E1-3-M2]MEB2785247.1 divalent metal cation transporter [Algoriphagus sp. E1-3-M2]
MIVCTLAGVNFGFSLLWALGLFILATLVLQEISGRLGLVTGQDLSQMDHITASPVVRISYPSGISVELFGAVDAVTVRELVG